MKRFKSVYKHCFLHISLSIDWSRKTPVSTWIVNLRYRPSTLHPSIFSKHRDQTSSTVFVERSADLYRSTHRDEIRHRKKESETLCLHVKWNKVIFFLKNIESMSQMWNFSTLTVNWRCNEFIVQLKMKVSLDASLKLICAALNRLIEQKRLFIHLTSNSRRLLLCTNALDGTGVYMICWIWDVFISRFDSVD